MSPTARPHGVEVLASVSLQLPLLSQAKLWQVVPVLQVVPTLAGRAPQPPEPSQK